MTLTDRSDTAALIKLLDSLAFVAVEHETSLDLLTLVAFIDLYGHHLEALEPSEVVPFEAFVRDASRLEAAARTAERVTGTPCRAAAPLGTPVPTRPVRVPLALACT